jgi:hypothetical protein
MRQLHRHLEIIPQAPVRGPHVSSGPSLYNHRILPLYNAQRETATDIGLCTNSAGGGGRLQRLRGRAEPTLPVRRPVCTDTAPAQLAHAHARRFGAQFTECTADRHWTATAEQLGSGHQGHQRAVRAMGRGDCAQVQDQEAE